MTASSEPPEPAPLGTRVLVMRLVREHVRRHLMRLILAALCMGIAAAATAAYAWLMEPVLNDVFLNKDTRMLMVLPVAVIAIFLVKGGATYGQAVFMSTAGQRIIADIQMRMFTHLMRADLAFFHDNATGKLVSRFTNDVNRLRAAVSTVLTGLVRDSLTVAFLVGVMFYQEWLLALIASFIFPLAIFPVVAIGRRMRRVSTSAQTEMGRFTTLLSETFQGAHHIKAYGMEAYETGRAAALVERLFRLISKALRVRAASTPIMETLGGLAIAAVILYGGLKVIAGATTAGAFFSFITALLLAYRPLKTLANLNANLQEGLAAAERVFALLDKEPEITDRPGARALDVREGTIRFERVSFAYAPDKPALHDVSLTIPAGKTVALVGPSGAGKSTILNLIPRFYDVDAGAVTIDSADVKDVTLASLSGQIALVSQETSLFNDTVRANIAYGKPRASDDEVAAAARAAAADEFILRLPKGYDCIVGEHGVKLSGGQRQRLSIARAMLKNAPILLLDEATSSLDTESERMVQAALMRLIKGRTTLVIAHRLSTVIRADLIYVIERGRVVESGSHAELLAKGGAYARLYEMQFAAEAEEGTARRARA
ncbi:MAG: lipid A export permease/ATP-binding protein MsbA [Alphaproteobacteria bacterium]